MDGWAELHAKFGKLPMKDVLAEICAAAPGVVVLDVDGDAVPIDENHPAPRSTMAGTFPGPTPYAGFPELYAARTIG